MMWKSIPIIIRIGRSVNRGNHLMHTKIEMENKTAMLMLTMVGVKKAR